jgi:hydroxymethylglutaryl-CoA synthase
VDDTKYQREDDSLKTLTRVGIESMAVYIPHHFVDLGTLARANKVDPAKYYIGLGVKRMAVVAPDEDPVTMAVEAGRTLMVRNRIDPDEIGLLMVGTESGVDGAKPIASYVHGLLGLSANCRTFDTKHACYSGTAALHMAADWCALRTGTRRGKALVIATDIARYNTGSSGEPTQGAGAVALLVSDQPHALELDPHPEAFFTREVMDFWRPHYRSEAVVDGRTSIDSYLLALEYTYAMYARNTGLRWRDLDYLLFHVPFPKMAYKGFKLLYEREGQKENGTGTRPLNEEYENRTEPALWANRELGNIYSGSLYMSPTEAVAARSFSRDAWAAMLRNGSGKSVSPTACRKGSS